MAPNTPSKPRAPRLTADDQVQFLLSCIRNATGGGKIDFANVAKECDIVTKGAAAKRYERLLKANNITPAGSSSTPTSKVTNDENTDEDEADGLEAAATGGAGKGRKRLAAATAGRKGKTSGLLARKKTKGQLMKEMAVARAHRMVGMSDSGDDTIKQEDGEDDDEEDGMTIKKEDADEEMLMEDENKEGEIGAGGELLALDQAGFDDCDQEGTV